MAEESTPQAGNTGAAQPALATCVDCEAKVPTVVSVECDPCGNAFDICGDCAPLDGDVYVCRDCDSGDDDPQVDGSD